MSITLLAISAATFLVEATAKHLLGKGLDKLFSEDEFQIELNKVIENTLSEYKFNFSIKSEEGKIPFYDSQLVINELLKISLFKEDGDVEKIISELNKSNIITPNNTQISELLNIFYSKIQENEKLKLLKIEANYKTEIFSISQAIRQLNSSVNTTISQISTDLTSEWKRQLDVYKDNLQQFKPKTALSLLIKLETAIKESDTFVSDKIDSKLHYLKALCYSILLDATNANKEYLYCYSKDSNFSVYKEKVALVYYNLNNPHKANELAGEIVQIDFDNPIANFILSMDDNENIFYNNIKLMPEYIRRNKTFKYLILKHIQKQMNGLIPLQQFLIDDNNITTTESVNFDNFHTCIYNVENAINVYITSNLYINFKERTKSCPILELIYNECKNISEAIKDSEVEDLYKGVYFWYYLADYIVNDNKDSLVSAKSHLM